MSNVVISIGRQFGAGGRVIGQRLAKELGYKYYDKELIPLAAKSVGFDPMVFETIDECPRYLRFFKNFTDAGTSDSNYMSNGKLFKIQSDVLRELANESPCVVVGRCSDYVLRDNDRMVSVFFHATEEYRIKAVMERNGVNEKKALKMMKRNDNNRRNYYETYTGKEWGDGASYDLCLNVSKLGEDKVVEIIKNVII